MSCFTYINYTNAVYMHVIMNTGPAILYLSQSSSCSPHVLPYIPHRSHSYEQCDFARGDNTPHSDLGIQVRSLFVYLTTLQPICSSDDLYLLQDKVGRASWSWLCTSRSQECSTWAFIRWMTIYGHCCEAVLVLLTVYACIRINVLCSLLQ